jgi:hypothetical protein
LAYLCQLEGALQAQDTIPCVPSKSHYPVREDCSKLIRMQDRETNRNTERPGAANRLTETRRDEPANQQLGETNRETSRVGQQHTVKEAAEVLGITVDAVRGRIRRGTLDSVKVNGVVYVLLDATNREQQSDRSATEAGDGPQLAHDQSELVGELRGQIDWLRREVERKDTIIMQMAQRIPELEPASEPPGSPVSPSEGEEGRGTAQGQQEPAQRRSWLYRFFFGP